MAKTFRLYFDGATLNNGSADSRSAVGVVVVDNDTVVHTHHAKVPDGLTNNDTEWLACCAAMNLAKRAEDKYPGSKFEIFGDSQLVVKQFNDEWKVKPKFLKYKSEAESLSDGIDLKLEWIPRDQNLAHDEAEKAFDKKDIKQRKVFYKTDIINFIEDFKRTIDTTQIEMVDVDALLESHFGI